MGKNIVIMVIVLFATLAVLGIIYAVNNINLNFSRPLEEVLMPEEGDVLSPVSGADGNVLTVPSEFMPGANTIPSRTPTPEESGENIELVDEELSSNINQEAVAGEQVGNENEAVFCTMDAKMCPDGSFVGRIAPNCDFAPCLEE